MSLGEATELYGTLQEIDVLLGKLAVKTETVKTEAGHAVGQVREVEYIFYRLTSLMSRMGLPPQIDSAIQKLQKMVLTIRMLHTAFILLESTTPYGWILGVISIGAVAITSSDYIMSIGE